MITLKAINKVKLQGSELRPSLFEDGQLFTGRSCLGLDLVSRGDALPDKSICCRRGCQWMLKLIS